MDEILVRAPAQLTALSRGPFRDEALAALASLEHGHGPGRLVVELTDTGLIDSAGLGTLVMLQLRAAERRHAVVLRGVPEEVRLMLLMSRLDDRFEIEPRP